MENKVNDQDPTQTPEEAAEAQEPQTEPREEVPNGTDPEKEALQQELADAREQALRAQAELLNVRRRAEQDVEKAHKFGQEKLIGELLPVVDNLERALASIDTSDEAFKPVIEGIELTHKSFLDTLARYQVEVIAPHGEPFNPQLHQAMTMVDNPDVEPNTVIDVFQKGYTLHGRLVRPAMVVVSKS